MARRPGDRRPLHHGWTLSPLGPPDAADALAAAPPITIPATVPGDIRADLIRADLIRADLIRADLIGTAAGRGGATDLDRLAGDHRLAGGDWRYTLELDTSAEQAHDHLDLECDGLDTLATIRLDGRLVGVTANAHRRHRFDLADGLCPGDHVLTIDLASPAAHARRLRDRYGTWPTEVADAPYNYVRTRLGARDDTSVTPGTGSTGIWRSIRLHAWSGARLDDVRVETSIDGRLGRVAIETPIVGSRLLTEALDVVVEHVLTDEAGDVVARRRSDVALVDDHTVITAELAVDDVRRWWPRSLGVPHRYHLAVRLLADGVELDRWTASIGFRTIELDTSADELGSRFVFVVNGVAVFARGVTWTPSDAGPAPHGAVRDLLRLACAANADLVRVSAHGCYESDEFYDACDALGLLVWQDLPFAAGAYPEQLLRDEVRAEIRDNVVRLHHHPCLALWNGNHECQLVHAEHQWQDLLDGRAWGAGFWTDDVPLVLEELDPSRPYWPGSPYSGPRLAPNSDLHGTTHLWDAWQHADVERFREHASRFVADLGWHGPSVASDERSERSERDESGERERIDRGVRRLIGDVPTDRDRRTYAAVVTQARAARTGIEHFRSLRGHCMGTVWSQLVGHERPTGSSMVSVDGRPEPVWHAVRDAYADRLLTVQPRGHELVLHVVNDSTAAWWAKGTIERTTLDGSVRISQTIDVVAGPHSVARIVVDPCVASPRDPSNEVLVAEVDGARAWWWFAPDEDVRLLRPSLDAEVVARPDGRLALTLTADTVVRDLLIAPDRLVPGATIDRQLVTMRPRRPETFVLSGIPDVTRLDVAALLARPATFSGADLGRAD